MAKVKSEGLLQFEREVAALEKRTGDGEFSDLRELGLECSRILKKALPRMTAAERDAIQRMELHAHHVGATILAELGHAVPVSGVNYFSLSTTTIFPSSLNLLIAFSSPSAGRRQPDRRRRRRFSSGPPRTVGGKVGNLLSVFHFSAASSERWECGNLSLPVAGFPRGWGNGGKPAFGFPRFPQSCHFHRSLPGAAHGSSLCCFFFASSTR